MLTDLWQYRGFVFDTVKREFQARYLNSVLGSLWAFLHPLGTILIYTVIFGRLMKPRLGAIDDPMAYGVFLCAGIMTWGLFTEVIDGCLRVFIEHANLLKKARFPRTTLPVIVLLSATVNFVLVFGTLLLLLALFGRFPGQAVVALLPLVLVQQSLALGLGVGLGVVNVFFRDVGHVVSVLLPVWFWLTPIVYPHQILSEPVRQLLWLNPLTNIMIAYQRVILEGAWPDWSWCILPVMAAAVALGAGAFIFRRLSGEMADYL